MKGILGSESASLTMHLSKGLSTLSASNEGIPVGEPSVWESFLAKELTSLKGLKLKAKLLVMRRARVTQEQTNFHAILQEKRRILLKSAEKSVFGGIEAWSFSFAETPVELR
jgi:hypothetical protein